MSKPRHALYQPTAHRKHQGTAGSLRLSSVATVGESLAMGRVPLSRVTALVRSLQLNTRMCVDTETAEHALGQRNTARTLTVLKKQKITGHLKRLQWDTDISASE